MSGIWLTRRSPRLFSKTFKTNLFITSGSNDHIGVNYSKKRVLNFSIVHRFSIFYPFVNFLSFISRFSHFFEFYLFFLFFSIFFWQWYEIVSSDLPLEFFFSHSIPDGLWWCLQTLTTLGYGDIIPLSLPGRCFAGFFMLLGAITISLPILTIVSQFVRLYPKNIALVSNSGNCLTPLIFRSPLIMVQGE